MRGNVSLRRLSGGLGLVWGAWLLSTNAWSCRLADSLDSFTAGSGDGGLGGTAGAGGAAGTAGGGAAGTAGAGGAAGAQGIPLVDLPAAAAQAYCNAFARCAGPAMVFQFFDEDCATVIARYFEDGELAEIWNSIAEGRVSYHAELGPECVAALDAAPCAEVGAWPAACADAIEGLVPVGDDCERNVDCEDGLFCDVWEATCPGSCAPRVAAGGACERDAACKPGLICRQGSCAEPAGIGEACVSDYGLIGSDCQFPLLCYRNACVDIAPLFVSPEGIGCSLGKGPLCAAGLHCALDSADLDGTCRTQALPGGPCRVAIPDQCPANQYCQVASAYDGVCTALPGSNQPCVEPFEGYGPPCQAYHRCLGGVCVPMRRLDEPCEGNLQCYSELCGAGSTCELRDACQ